MSVGSAFPHSQHHPQRSATAVHSLGVAHVEATTEPSLPQPGGTGEVPADLVDALRGFFKEQKAPRKWRKSSNGLLDVEGFAHAQSVLAETLGEAGDPTVAMAAFLKIATLASHHASAGQSSSQSTFQVFSRWQLGELQARGLSWDRMVDVLRHSTQRFDTSAHIPCSRFHLAAKEMDREERERSKIEGQQMMGRIGHANHRNVLLPLLPPREDGAQSSTHHGVEKERHKLVAVQDAGGQSRATKFEKQQSSLVVEEGSWLSEPQQSPQRQSGSRKKKSVQPKQQKELRTDVAGIEPSADQSAISRDDSDVPQSLGHHLSKQNAFLVLAARGRDAPESCASSLGGLVEYLVAPATSDPQRAWVLFSWVCHHVEYDVDGLHGRAPRQSCQPHDVLKSRKSVCGGYASIYGNMAAEAGLVVREISGHARNSSRRVGQDVVRENVGAHAWNAVKLGEEWILVDCTWGAGTCTDTAFEQAFRPHFFGPPPEQLAYTHYPRDAEWQLLKKTLTYADFIAQPIVCTSVFFEHRLCFVSSRSRRPEGFVNLDSSTRVGSLQLRVPPDTFIMLTLNGSRSGCSQKADPRTGVVTITCSADQCPDQGLPLEVFVRKGSPFGNYQFACTFVLRQC